ncbi:MAG: hypothetical protein IIZ78_27560 [Clostridiales bacterium]|nr:hypothetical protein [Clostridiales bacterium]
MIREKVTKQDLEKMALNEQKVFTLPSYNKARSAQSYASQMKKATAGTLCPRAFTAVIGDPAPNGQCGVTITRIL